VEEVYWTSTNWRVCRVKVRCPYISVLALSVGLRSVPGSTILVTTPVRLVHWTDSAVRRHRGLARIIYFVLISACTFPQCPQQILTRVEWFNVDSKKGTATLESRANAALAPAHALPVQVVLVPVLRLASKGPGVIDFSA
jgi:hypothetical protein